jgi:hypothetical protein
MNIVSQNDSETLSNQHPAAIQYLIIIGLIIEYQPPNYVPFHSLSNNSPSENKFSSSVLGYSITSFILARAMQYGGESGDIVNRLAYIASTDS